MTEFRLNLPERGKARKERERQTETHRTLSTVANEPETSPRLHRLPHEPSTAMPSITRNPLLVETNPLYQDYNPQLAKERLLARKNPWTGWFTRETAHEPIWMRDDNVLESFTHFRSEDYEELMACLNWNRDSYFTTSTGINYGTRYGLVVLLFRLSGSQEYKSMAWFFSSSMGNLGTIFNDILWRFYNSTRHMLKHIEQWKPLFNTFGNSIQRVFAQQPGIHHFPGLREQIFIGFVDGTNLPIQKPTGPVEQAFYSGHHKQHEAAFQITSAPNGMILHCQGPLPGTRNDIQLFHDCSRTNLCIDLCECTQVGEQFPLLIGDPAYHPERLIATAKKPDPGCELSREAQNYNGILANVRVEVERTIGALKTKFGMIGNDGRRLKLGESAVSPIWDSCCILHNLVLTCRSRRNIRRPDRFACPLPTMAGYFQLHSKHAPINNGLPRLI